MTTGLDIVKQSMKDIGVLGIGQEPSAEDINDCFLKLNWMIGQWQVQRWMVYHLVDMSKVATGALSYTIGPAGDFPMTVAPDKVEAAFVRNLQSSTPNQPDYYLEIILAREDYNNIALKNLVTFPKWLFYDSNFPLGNLYFWPVPSSALYEMHISVKQLLSQIATPATAINLPLHYYMALCMNLSILLAPAYGRPIDPQFMLNARKALNVVKMANYQIGRLQMPKEIIRRGVFDVYSGRVI